MEASRILAAHLGQLHLSRGAVVVMDPYTGDLLASVNAPLADPHGDAAGEVFNSLLDRARYGLYPPGSTFKIVTAMAALRLDPSLAALHYQCIRLPDGRTGNYVGNSRRPVRDDEKDRTAHGTLDMHMAIVVSCNAYFAQLGTYRVGPENLLDTAKRVGISVADPPTAANLKPQMPQASYGQGQVVVTPFQMARVASAVAAGGNLTAGRWVTDESNTRTQPAQALLKPELAAMIGKDMRNVVLNGTGRILAAVKPAIAGKTGTAELAGAPSHAWFIGFAPFDDDAHRIAFSVLVENGRYGGSAAAPVAGEIAMAAERLHLIP
jgi:peptidoglycan glycosyltransferase